jgi:hypothetical protein
VSWRLRWSLTIEHTPEAGGEVHSSRLVRWAVLGLAVLGATAVLLVRHLHG